MATATKAPQTAPAQEPKTRSKAGPNDGRRRKPNEKGLRIVVAKAVAEQIPVVTIVPTPEEQDAFYAKQRRAKVSAAETAKRVAAYAAGETISAQAAVADLVSATYGGLTPQLQSTKDLLAALKGTKARKRS